MPTGFERGHCAGKRGTNRALCRASARAAQLRHRPHTDEHPILAGRNRDDSHRHPDRRNGDEQRSLGMVHRGAGADGICDFRHDTVSIAASVIVKGPPEDTWTPGNAALTYPGPWTPPRSSDAKSQPRIKQLLQTA
jgi:hypothetical protein